MATRTDDVVGFRRIFVLFITLVLLPALFMSGFGVIAIVNVNGAEKQRRHELGEAVLRRAEARFVETLERTDRALETSLTDAATPADAMGRVRDEDAPLGDWALYRDTGGGWLLEGGSMPALADDVIQGLVKAAPPRPTARATYLAVDGAGVLVLKRIRDGGAILAAVIDVDALTRAFTDLDDDAEVIVVADATSSEPVRDALQRVVQEMSAEDSKETLAERRLDPPFSSLTMEVKTPPSSSSTTIMVLYIVLLAVFLATLITGVVITARLIYQETRLSRLKTDFVSHMSHELRTPLTSIRLFIETLRLGRAESPEEQEECLSLLQKETERLSEMIERVLGYARLKAGRRVFQQNDVDVEAVVRDAIDAFRAQTLADQTAVDSRDDRQLAFTTEVQEGLPPIHVDREAAVEALLNLIGNAWKYTGPHKRIRVFARAGRRGRVVLGVQDNGPGLPKGEHKRVFERFYQSRSLLSSKQPGSGLGLAITKAIVEGQGGRVAVESEPGTGSTFSIELPAARPGRVGQSQA